METIEILFYSILCIVCALAIILMIIIKFVDNKEIRRLKQTEPVSGCLTKEGFLAKLKKEKKAKSILCLQIAQAPKKLAELGALEYTQIIQGIAKILKECEPLCCHYNYYVFSIATDLQTATEVLSLLEKIRKQASEELICGISVHMNAEVGFQAAQLALQYALGNQNGTEVYTEDMGKEKVIDTAFPVEQPEIEAASPCLLEEQEEAKEPETLAEAKEDVEEEDGEEEERLQALIEEYKKRYQDEWEAEMLKKYPDLLKKQYERREFSEKLMQLDSKQKDNFNILKNALMKYKLKNRTTKYFDTFIYKNRVICKIGVVGKSMRLFLALDPKAYPEGQYPHKDVSMKKRHEKTPYLMKIFSDLSVKRGLKLIQDLINVFQIEVNDDFREKNYSRGIQLSMSKK